MLKRYERSIKDDHLPWPREFNKDQPRQKKLNAFFLRPTNDPLERLKELDRKFDVGGAPPYVAKRRERTEAQEMFEIRHSESGDRKTTGVPVGEMTIEQAEELDEVRNALTAFSVDKLFELQAEHAAATLRYSTIIRRFLVSRDRSTSDPEQDRERKALNKQRNVASFDDTLRQMTYRADVLIEGLFGTRTLKDHHFGLTGEIKDWLVDRALEKGAQLDVRGQPAGALDSTAAAYVSLVRQALAWLAKKHRPPVRLDMETLKVVSGRSEPLMWADARLIVLWSRGYVWENGGFACEWVWRDGDWHLEWKREGDAFRQKYAPLLRHVLSYETVSTRLTCALHMGWKPHDYRGWVDFDQNEVVRTGSLGPNYVNKPRETTVMLPFVQKMFGTWLANDRRKAASENWTDPHLAYVIHDGHGGPAWKIAALVKNACEKLGIKKSSHKMKVANVTQLYLAGIDLFKAASMVGNEPLSTVKHYLFLQKKYEGIKRPNPDRDTMTFVDLVNPDGKLPPIPRAPIPPRPVSPLPGP